MTYLAGNKTDAGVNRRLSDKEAALFRRKTMTMQRRIPGRADRGPSGGTHTGWSRRQP